MPSGPPPPGRVTSATLRPVGWLPASSVVPEGELAETVAEIDCDSTCVFAEDSEVKVVIRIEASGGDCGWCRQL